MVTGVQTCALPILTIEPALGIDGQSVGARFAGSRSLAGVAAGLEVHAHVLAFLPAIDRVARHIGKEQIATVLEPDRPLGPVEAGSQFLEWRGKFDEREEIRVVDFERAEGFPRVGFDFRRQAGMAVVAGLAAGEEERGENEREWSGRVHGLTWIRG